METNVLSSVLFVGNVSRGLITAGPMSGAIHIGVFTSANFVEKAIVDQMLEMLMKRIAEP